MPFEEPETDINYSLEESSSDVIIDNFANSVIDVDDVDKFADSNVVPKVAILGHSIAEQRAKHRKNNPKENATTTHQKDGLPAESKITGYTRDEDKTTDTKKSDPPGSKTSFTGRVFWNI